MEVCAICGVNPAVGVGEHVWPKWYLKDADKAGPPPFAWTRNGDPITDRNGNQLAFNERQRLLIPACEQCNSELDRRFEKPAKEAVRRLSAHGWIGDASAEEWKAVGLWFAKILMLSTHPEAHHQHPKINEHPIVGDWSVEHFSWLIDGSPPPDDLSLWLFRAELDGEGGYDGVFVPRSVTDGDNRTTPFPFTLVTTNGVCLTLLWHPGWPVIHPLEARGEAWELLHADHDGDLSALPVLPHTAVRWRPSDVVLLDGFALDGTLPPIRATNDAPLPPEFIDVIKGQF